MGIVPLSGSEKESIGQGFVNNQGLHYRYEINWCYDEFYISDGEARVDISYKELPSIIKSLTDFGRAYEDYHKKEDDEEKDVLTEV